MRKWLLCVIVFAGMACGDSDITNPSEIVYDQILDARLTPNADGFFELELNQNATQTIHRISGHVFADGQALANQRVMWESSHFWTLSDTLTVISRKTCPYPDNANVECLWYVTSKGAVRDTVYLTQFVGQEVTTVNAVSISASDGEINTVFAPVRWMLGDTVTITAHALFRNGTQKDSIRIILR